MISGYVFIKVIEDRDSVRKSCHIGSDGMEASTSFLCSSRCRCTSDLGSMCNSMQLCNSQPKAHDKAADCHLPNESAEQPWSKKTHAPPVNTSRSQCKSTPVWRMHSKAQLQQRAPAHDQRLGGGAGWDLLDSVDNNHTVRSCVSAKILYGSYSLHFQPTFTSGAVGWRIVVCMVLKVSTVESVERGQFLEGEP